VTDPQIVTVDRKGMNRAAYKAAMKSYLDSLDPATRAMYLVSTPYAAQQLEADKNLSAEGAFSKSKQYEKAHTKTFIMGDTSPGWLLSETLWSLETMGQMGDAEGAGDTAAFANLTARILHRFDEAIWAPEREAANQLALAKKGVELLGKVLPFEDEILDSLIDNQDPRMKEYLDLQFMNKLGVSVKDIDDVIELDTIHVTIPAQISQARKPTGRARCPSKNSASCAVRSSRSSTV
jgi:hypothetical protein